MSSRPRLPGALALAVIVFVTVGLSLVGTPTRADAAMTSAEQEVLDLINEERARNGLDALVATKTLDAAAAWLAADLSTIDGLDHTDTLGRSLRDRLNAFDYPANSTIRENIAAGYATPASVVKGWIESPGHYANILAKDAIAAGIALHEVPGTTYRYFWVIDFGSVVDSSPPGGAAPPTVTTVAPVQVTGSVPTSGVGLIVVQETAAPEQLIASVAAKGCTRATVWITLNGAFIGYLPGAPGFVNSDFPLSLPAGTPFIVSCA
ncbi:MAG: CAP domain-containing protein [Chloroflexi bacterium]|nr:CAP domain-containing protein [Chloroflexota bacterium]MDA1146450.1 CAP domain-containing protein [Chloroflexota bacterium]MQC82319.1 CAP domain-containing protein [Chloroflexota bacterium]MQC82621.1 CAP domain-containing protein [Chloroflexota bacterium]